VLAFLFESSDLFLSNILYNPSAGWAKFLEMYGEIPGLIVTLIGIYIYFNTNKLSSNSKRILTYFFLLLVSTAGVIYVNYLISHYAFGVRFNSLIEIYILIIGSFLINFFTIIYIRKKIKFSFRQYYFSRIIIRMITFGFLLTTLPLKFFWGRLRFRDLNGDFSHFTVWYIPNGFNGSDSFPSGRAAMSWMLIGLFVLISDKSVFVRTTLKSLIISYALIVCISRIVIGAHFASDVLFGSMFVIMSYIISNHLLFDERRKG
jgi:membrane-associated phospholipid phosphatase